MLIDTLSIAYSNNVGSNRLANPTVVRFINAWSSLLGAHGWTQSASLHATASLTFPLGIPITDGVTIPHVPVSCSAFPGVLAIGTQWFTMYDPFKQDPAVGMCIFVPEGLTIAASIANLVSAVNGSTPWVAVAVQNSPVDFTINFTALAGGAEFNQIYFQSSGFASGASHSSGGGYEMQSSGDSNSAVYKCACTNAFDGGAGINYLFGNILFTFTINGQNTSYQILDSIQGTLGFLGALGVGSVPFYTIVANPYGFAVFDEPHDQTKHLFRTISLFCMAPYFPSIESVPPSEHFVPAYAVFVIGPNNPGSAPSWADQTWDRSSMCLDGSIFRQHGFNASARLLAYRSPIFPLLTPQAVPFHYGAYVQFGQLPSDADPAWVVGKVWDVALVTDFVDEEAIIDGRQFLTMGFSSDPGAGYTVCTVMMAAAAPAGDTLSGTVNLFGDGVTWVSGDLFIPEMVGAAITIGGTAYTVKSVTDSTHLVLTTALTIGSGLAYTAADPTAVETGGQPMSCVAGPGSPGGAGIFSNSGH